MDVCTIATTGLQIIIKFKQKVYRRYLRQLLPLNLLLAVQMHVLSHPRMFGAYSALRIEHLQIDFGRSHGLFGWFFGLLCCMNLRIRHRA
jgi:hypothetical protein